MQKMDWLKIAISGSILLLLDGTFIYTNLENYQKTIRNIQGSSITWKGFGGILFCYICLIGGLYHFILKEKRSWVDAFFFGIIIYGVYATTIYTMFKGYPAYLAIIDVLWGGILMASTTQITYFMTKQMV